VRALSSHSEMGWILGVRVDATTYERAVDAVCSCAVEGSSRYVCVATVNNVMEAYDSPEFAKVMNEADLVTPDGMPLVWGLRLLAGKPATRVYGPDLALAVLERAAQAGIPVGFYGASEAVLHRLLEEVARRFPRLKTVYWHSPPFRSLSPAEDATVVRAFNASGAKILFVGLNTPKQDYWMAAHRHRINAVMLGVGAAFDFIAGTKRQAPRWVMHCGLEWLFRLATEPRRLWKRYLKHNPRFIVLFLIQLLRSHRHSADTQRHTAP
jgi:N-acetylglucosaminyldiphosphoundecaprenol N-acetyl-beta-D-mannosaminyltransferase